MIQRHLGAGEFSHLDSPLGNREETLFLDLERVVAVNEAGKILAAGVVGLAVYERSLWGS